MVWLSEVSDVYRGIKNIKMAVWLAKEDLRGRYTRTALGPWWNVLSSAIFVMAMAVTFGALFRQPIKDFLPYVAASVGCWNMINSTLCDAPLALIRGSGIITAYPLPLSTQVFRIVVDKFVLLSHFLLIYALLVIVLRHPVDLLALSLFIPAMLIYATAAVGATLMLSVLGARFRDIAPAIASIMVLFFLVTPVFWQKEALSGKAHWITTFNPFFHLIEVGRSPLLGRFASWEHWAVSIGIAVALLISGLITFAAMRRRIFYWL